MVDTERKQQSWLQSICQICRHCIHDKSLVYNRLFTLSAHFTDGASGVIMQATNRRTLGAMVKEMGKGGKLVWIAPSGGRDRPDPQTGDWLPHRYDPGMLPCFRV